LFSAIYIALGILLLPQLGAATFFALLIAGQMLGSVMFEHFGLMGVPIHPISPAHLRNFDTPLMHSSMCRMCRWFATGPGEQS
jgi:hypothetical protein